MPMVGLTFNVSAQRTQVDQNPAAVVGSQAAGLGGVQRWGNSSPIMLLR